MRTFLFFITLLSFLPLKATEDILFLQQPVFNSPTLSFDEWEGQLNTWSDQFNTASSNHNIYITQTTKNILESYKAHYDSDVSDDNEFTWRARNTTLRNQLRLSLLEDARAKIVHGKGKITFGPNGNIILVGSTWTTSGTTESLLSPCVHIIGEKKKFEELHTFSKTKFIFKKGGSITAKKVKFVDTGENLSRRAFLERIGVLKKPAKKKAAAAKKKKAAAAKKKKAAAAKKKKAAAAKKKKAAAAKKKKAAAAKKKKAAAAKKKKAAAAKKKKAAAAKKKKAAAAKKKKAAAAKKKKVAAAKKKKAAAAKKKKAAATKKKKAAAAKKKKAAAAKKKKAAAAKKKKAAAAKKKKAAAAKKKKAAAAKKKKAAAAKKKKAAAAKKKKAAAAKKNKAAAAKKKKAAAAKKKKAAAAKKKKAAAAKKKKAAAAKKKKAAAAKKKKAAAAKKKKAAKKLPKDIRRLISEFGQMSAPRKKRTLIKNLIKSIAQTKYGCEDIRDFMRTCSAWAVNQDDIRKALFKLLYAGYTDSHSRNSALKYLAYLNTEHVGYTESKYNQTLHFLKKIDKFSTGRNLIEEFIDMHTYKELYKIRIDFRSSCQETLQDASPQLQTLFAQLNEVLNA